MSKAGALIGLLRSGEVPAYGQPTAVTEPFEMAGDDALDHVELVRVGASARSSRHCGCGCMPQVSQPKSAKPR